MKLKTAVKIPDLSALRNASSGSGPLSSNVPSGGGGSPIVGVSSTSCPASNHIANILVSDWCSETAFR